MKKSNILLLLVLFSIIACKNQPIHSKRAIKDTKQQIHQRRISERTNDAEMERKIDDLLSSMTIEEKIGQMIQVTVDVIAETKEYNETESGIIEISLDTTKLNLFLDKFPIGALINGYGFTPQNWYEFNTQLQTYNKNNTRLSIPILYAQDHQHGANYVAGATIFPHSLNMASAFNRELIAEEARITGIESADLGHRWILGPIADLGCNPLWPRIYETYGEDPYLVSELCKIQLQTRKSSAEINPFKQVSCAKHFLGYSAPQAGWDRTPVDISWQQLYELHIPSFKTIIDNGIDAIMLNSGELNGEAVHGSYNIITHLLRDKLGFKGVVITDWNDIVKMYKYHKVAANEKDAILKAINAGIDISMEPEDLSFGELLFELINEGKVTEDRIDLSVARIIRLKMNAGLFEHPMPRNDRFEMIGKADHHKIASQAAEESIVLLKNDGILPLKSNINSMIIVGPNADNKKALCGGWTYRWWPQTDDIFPKSMNTVYHALKNTFTKTSIEIATVKNLAKKSKNVDAIILALGEQPHAEGFGNVNNLSLDEGQKQIVDIAISSGKPIILVMIGSRPLIATKAFNNSKAFIWAGLPGIHGGDAIASILKGNTNPSGKLSFSYPANNGHYYNYNHKPSHTHYDIPPQDSTTHIGTFGEGLSYSKFKYSEIELSDSILNMESAITATVQIENTSTIDGKESVLWYINDEIASITRPVKALKHFDKDLIKAGESKTFTFTISPSILSFPDAHGNDIIEEGYFTLMCGNHKVRFKLNSTTVH